MKILLAHPGTQHAPKLAIELHNRGILMNYHTGILFGKDSIYFKILRHLPNKVWKLLSNRFIDLPDNLIKRHIYIEVNSLLKIKYGHKNSELSIYYNRNKSFQKSIPKKDIIKCSAIIGFDTSSWILIERARFYNKRFYLEVTSIHSKSKKEIYSIIQEQFPDWENEIKQKPEYLVEIEEKELINSDYIIIASSFSKNTLIENNIPSNKIIHNPYGVELNEFQPIDKPNLEQNVNFVFLGRVDNPNKGIPLLLKAWKNFKDSKSHLTLIGQINPQLREFILSKYNNITILGVIPYKQVKNLLPQYDVMVFPSYFEGFGLVILQAMASGLPVITTKSTCGPDIIENGIDGFVINTGDELFLKEKILYFINNKDEIKIIGNNARKKALNFSWKSYGDRWFEILNNMKN